MDTVELVENQIDDGQRLIDALDDAGIKVAAALWLKPFEVNRWKLYIAAPLVEDATTPRTASQEVYQILRGLSAGWLDSQDVRVIGDNDQLAVDAAELLERLSGRGGIRLRDRSVGKVRAEELYLYPLSKKKITVYGLVFPGEPSGALNLSLEPAKAPSALVVESPNHRQEYPGQSQIWEVMAPGDARLERNDIGLLALRWNLHGKKHESSANEVLALARLGYHGFRVVQNPGR